MKKNVVVTGGASGIGRATGEAYLKLGDNVVLTDIDSDSLLSTVNELKQLYPAAGVYHKVSDVACIDSVKALADFVKTEVGNCDILVNSAGVFRGGLIHLASEDDFNIQFDINVRGIFHTLKAFIPQMLEKGKGAIVNISSLSGIRGDYNAPLYCASKSAVVSLSQATALDYAEIGIRINCVSPSATKTPMFLSGTSDKVMNDFLSALPDHKLGNPAHVADAIVFLASEAAEHIIGQNLAVDGGLSAWNGQPRQSKD